MNRPITLRGITDSDILKITKGRKVTNPEDFNLREGSKSASTSWLHPVMGGLYDSRLFGSIYDDKCNCGHTRVANIPCPICNSMLLNKVDRETRYAYIDLRYYYTNSVKLPALIKFIKSFSVKLMISDKILHAESLNDQVWMEYIYLCQFNAVNGKLVITDTLDDASKISIEGLIKAVTEIHPERVPELMTLVNRYYLVYPSILRKVKYFIVDGKKKLKLPKSTAYYRSIIIAVDIVAHLVAESSDLYKNTAYIANLRNYISRVVDQMSGILKSSKSTYIRSNYKINSRKSGRAVISGDPTLPIDTIKIPRVLAYEMYKRQFILHLIDSQGYLESDAVKAYNNPTPELNKIFDEFCSHQVVLINRPPTLHAENIQAYKLALSEDYGIHFPLLTTAAQNADFDGDAVTFYAVPEDKKEYVYDHCSPSRYTGYVNNDEPILKVRHEILYGLTLATKCIEGEVVREFNGVADLVKAYQDDEIWVNDMVRIGEYPTSFGRERVAGALKIDSLNDLIGEEPINASNVVKIYEVINAMSPEDKVKCLKTLQDFALEVVTLEGATSLDLKELYFEIPSKYKKQIAEVLDSDAPQSEKILEAETIHTEMINEMLTSDQGLTPETVTRIKEGNRGKMSAIIDMLVPSFIIDRKGELQYPEHSLVEGLTEEEYRLHSSMNRESLMTKANMVPFSGYFNRQLKEPGMKIILMKDEEDTDDPGLEIPMNMAEGRTTIDGKIVPKSSSNEMVRVRSILTTNLPYATKDMFSTKYHFTYEKDGRCHVGAKFMLAYGADLTQKGLSLKHGAMNRYVGEEFKLRASVDTYVEIGETTIKFEATGEEFIKPTKFVTRGSGFYKKDQVVGEVPYLQTISYNIEAIVSLISAVGHLGNTDMTNKLRFSRCFNGPQEGVLTLDPNGTTIRIGKLIMTRDDRLYCHPLGTKIKPYSRFCSGLQSLKSLDKEDLTTRFLIFVNQMNELHSANLEVFEMIFRIITNGGDKFKGLLRSNTSGNDNALSAAGYGYASKAASRMLKGDLKIDQNDGGISEILLQPFLYELIDSLK